MAHIDEVQIQIRVEREDTNQTETSAHHPVREHLDDPRDLPACVAIDAHTERLKRRVVADLAWRVLRHLAPKRRNHGKEDGPLIVEVGGDLQAHREVRR